ESLEFLLAKQPKNALKQVNAFMKKLGKPPLTAMPPVEAETKAGLAEILKQPYLARVIIIIIAYFMTISVFYFGNFLMPKVLADQGLAPSTARLIPIMVTVGGMIGSITLGYLAAWFKIRHLTSIVCILATVMTSIFGFLLGDIWVLVAGAVVMGFFINAGIA